MKTDTMGFGPGGMKTLDALRAQARELEDGDPAARRAALRRLSAATVALGALEAACVVEDEAFDDVRDVAASALDALARLDPDWAKSAAHEGFAKALAGGRSKAMLWLGPRVSKAPQDAYRGANAGRWTAQKIVQSAWPAGVALMGWTGWACAAGAPPASFMALEALGLGPRDRREVYPELARELGGALGARALGWLHPWAAMLCSEEAPNDPMLEQALALWEPQSEAIWEALALRACEEGSALALSRLAGSGYVGGEACSKAAVKAAAGMLVEPQDGPRWEAESAPGLGALSGWLAKGVCQGADVMERLVDDLLEAFHQFPAYWAYDEAIAAAGALRRLGAWSSDPRSRGWGAVEPSRWEALAAQVAVEAASLSRDEAYPSQGQAQQALQSLARDASAWGTIGAGKTPRL